MKVWYRNLSLAALAALALTACQPADTGSTVAVLDLGALAQATGEDELIREKAEAGRVELNTQLQQLATDLDQQINAEREKLGESPSEEEAARIQQLTTQARQQIGQAQQQAQQQANQMELNLVDEFREAVLPLAQDIAKEKGVRLILSSDAYVFWADSSVDITAEVITAWQAQSAAADDAGQSAAGESSGAGEAAREPAAANEAAAPAE